LQALSFQVKLLVFQWRVPNAPLSQTDDNVAFCVQKILYAMGCTDSCILNDH